MTTASSRVLFSTALTFCLLAATAANAATGRDTIATNVDVSTSARETLGAVRVLESRLASLVERLAVANVTLCDRVQPWLGMQLHLPHQYSPAMRTQAAGFFGFLPSGGAGVESVVPGGGAEEAGIAVDDVVTHVGDIAAPPPPPPGAPATTAALVALDDAIAARDAHAPVSVGVVRQGRIEQIVVAPRPGCRARAEVDFDSGWTARADGTLVQIGYRFFDSFEDDQIAAIVAHELAHNILNHRGRLQAAGVRYGVWAGLGRNVRYFRQAELEADALSIALLANAGYDPAMALRFWQRFGPMKAGGPFNSRSHPAWRDRAAMMARVIAELPGSRAVRPPLLDQRLHPLDGDWQSLLYGSPGGRRDR